MSRRGMEKIDCLNFETMGVFEEDIFLFSKQFNYFLRIDKKKEKIDEIDFLPEEEFVKNNLISCILKWRNASLFIPRNAKHVYKKEGAVIRKIEIDNVEELDTDNKFLSAMVYEDYLFLFGHWIPKIIGINLISEKVEYSYDVPKRFVLMKEKNKDAFFSGHYVDNSRVYLPFLSGGYLTIFDLNNKEVDWILIDEKESGFSGITKLNNRDILLCRRNENGIIIYDEEKKKCKEKYTDISFRYSLNVFSLENKVWVTNYNRPSIVIDLLNDSYERIETKFVTVENKDDEFFGCSSEGVEIINSNFEIESIISIDGDCFDSLIEKKIKDKKISFNETIYESNSFNLCNFIRTIC